MSGWGVSLVPEACAGLPDRPCAIDGSELVRTLVRRANNRVFAERLEPQQERVCGVLLDELRRAPQE